MATVGEWLRIVERLAPPEFGLSGDRIGLQVGNPTTEVTGIVTCLDVTAATLDFATAANANLVVAHHPVIYDPLPHLRTDRGRGRLLADALRRDLAVVVAHTNWDAAPGGINDTLAAVLGLGNVRPFGQAGRAKELKVVVFAPAGELDLLVDAMSAAGAGEIGAYRRCAFFHGGHGTFLGEEGTNPVVGESGQVEIVEEVRLEMILPAHCRDNVAEAIRNHHPYEEPAFDFFVLDERPTVGIGRVGVLQSAMTLGELQSHVDVVLGTRSMAWGDAETEVSQVAVVGGAADEMWEQAIQAGAQALITGEVRHHVSIDASAAEFAIVAAGHYATEFPGMRTMATKLSELGHVGCWCWEPASGKDGRPNLT